MPVNPRKTEKPSLEEIATKIDKVAKEKNIDVDKLVSEAVEWARKSKKSSQKCLGD